MNKIKRHIHDRLIRQLIENENPPDFTAIIDYADQPSIPIKGRTINHCIHGSVEVKRATFYLDRNGFWQFYGEIED